MNSKECMLCALNGEKWCAWIARILTRGTAAGIRTEVMRLGAGFGADGGYILSACDHFFDTPVENLRALAAAGRDCVY